MDVFFNIYLLEKKLPIMKSILDLYSTFETTSIGSVLYFHLLAVGFLVTDQVFVGIWTISSFFLGWLVCYKLLVFIFKTMVR
jgi:hypothetical protein